MLTSFIHMAKIVYNSTNRGVNASMRSSASPHILTPGAGKIFKPCFVALVSIQFN